MKKSMCILLVIILTLTSFPIIASASNSNDFYCQYSGSTTASYGYKPNCTFTITQIVGDKFRGSFVATNLGSYNLSKQVEGTVYRHDYSFTCQFSIPEFYNTWFSILVHPYQGYCQCVTAGNWHFEDFEMTGTRFSFSNNEENILDDNLSIDDVKLCMNLSYLSYDVKSDKEIPDTLNSELDNLVGYDNGSVEIHNYSKKTNPNDVAFYMLTRTNTDSIDMFVVIRGTYNDEWKGNVQITGNEYKPQTNEHENFRIAKDSIKKNIVNYYNRTKRNNPSKNINLIITGHSRGAAVANLYARDVINKQQGFIDETVPDFSRAIAYTFACPNVAKYTSDMENYNNIYNFSFTEDLVATVPLTNPTTGWGYWKYGKSYSGSLLDDSVTTSQIHKEKDINSSSVQKIHAELGPWPTVSDYYNKPINTNVLTQTTLYEFAYDLLGIAKSKDPIQWFVRLGNGIFNIDALSEITPLLLRIKEYIPSIGAAHSQETYKNIVNYQIDNHTFFNYFQLYTYQDCLNDERFSQNNGTTSYAINTTETSIIPYNQTELNALITFFNNNSNLNWNNEEPSSWDGVIWNTSGNIEKIDFSFKNLTGTLDLSNFSSLTSLDVSGNNLTSINLTNCSSLEELDCSFNQLTTLDISDCTNLSSLTCCYNYLDTHEGGALYNTLENLMFNDCYVNYYPQAVPDNASFNTTELNVLKTFANTANNNSELDWIDDSGNIDTQKLQKNVLFEYDGSKYRVVAIDISDTNVEGTLNLTSFAQLKELYCENTKITSLNVNGCTKLETLQCDGCNITTLTLPSNSANKNTPLYDVSCEYNYIDTSIFTPTIVEYVNFKAGANLEYENQKGDSSALQAALSFANKLEEKDYSTSTYETLKELLDECNYYNFDNLYLTQSDIDDLTTEILTAMYELKAYFNVNISAPNGSFTIAYDDELFTDTAKHSLLYGTTVTLNATPNEGYSFFGWYDTVNNIYMSKNTQYTFRVSSNSKLKAVFVAEGSATLTFANYSNWIAGNVTKTTQEWAELTAIADLLPDVPYRYGYSNGRWVYDEFDVLAKLQAGEDVTIGAEYDDDNTSFPTPRVATDKPVLDLYYKYDFENTLGSFVMASGFPENIQVESVGIAFYYKDSSVFDPTDNFTLLLNNKMLVGRFNTDVLEDIYIVNMNNMTSAYNWSARGFVTYYDENGNLVTEYSNQINIIDTKNADEIVLYNQPLDNEKNQNVTEHDSQGIEVIDAGWI